MSKLSKLYDSSFFRSPIFPYVFYILAIIASILAVSLIIGIKGDRYVHPEAADDPPRTPAQTSGLCGDWRVVDKKLQDLDVEIIWTISESTITVRDGTTGEQVSQNKYTTDDSQDPKHFDTQIRDIVDEDRYGIYDLDGDKLRILQSLDGGKRPTDWSEGKVMMLERISVTGTR